MSTPLCQNWVNKVLLSGRIYPIYTAYLLYNGTLVAQASQVTAKITYQNTTPPGFEITLTIVDNTTSNYTYNEIQIADSQGNIIADYKYGQSYSKPANSQLTVTEYIFIQDVTPITQITGQFTAAGDYAQILANALVNGGTLQVPNAILIADDSYTIIEIANFSLSSWQSSIANGVLSYTGQINCSQCANLPSGYVVIGYYDQSTNTFIWVNYVYLASINSSTLTITWSIAVNSNC